MQSSLNPSFLFQNYLGDVWAGGRTAEADCGESRSLERRRPVTPDAVRRRIRRALKRQQTCNTCTVLTTETTCVLYSPVIRTTAAAPPLATYHSPSAGQILYTAPPIDFGHRLVIADQHCIRSLIGNTVNPEMYSYSYCSAKALL